MLAGWLAFIDIPSLKLLQRNKPCSIALRKLSKFCPNYSYFLFNDYLFIYYRPSAIQGHLSISIALLLFKREFISPLEHLHLYNFITL